jgi:hypothetical protein
MTIYGKPQILKIGTHSSFGPKIRASLVDDLGIPPKNAAGLNLRTLFMELGSQTNHELAYIGESYGYRVRVADDRDASFLRVWAARHGLPCVG